MADAPPIVAASADGVLHQFPAGTDPSVVDGVMKQYAQESAPKEEPKPPEESGPIDLGAMGRKAGQTLVGDAGATVTGVGAVTKGVGGAEKGQTSTDLDMMHAIDDGSDFGKLMKAAPNDLARLAIREYQLADADKRAQMKQQAINTMAAPPNQVETTGEHMMKAGEGITAAGKETFPVTPQEEERFDVKTAGVLAGIVKYVGVGATTGPAAIPALMGVAGVDAYGETYNKAKTAGATDEDATKAALMNGATQGALMALPVGQSLKIFNAVPAALKGNFLKALTEAAPILKSKIAGVAAKGGEGAATLFAFSQLSTIADNVSAGATYEPGRAPLEHTLENIPETLAAGALLPLVGAGANRLFRGRDAVPNPKAVLDAPNLNDAIAKADQVASGGAVDVEAMAAQAKGTAEEQQAKVLKLFSGLNDGEVRPTEDGGYAYHVGDKEMPLEVWDEKKAEPQAEGEEAQPTISPNVAADLRKHYGKLGVDVIYINDPDGKVPFDGAVDPQQPNTIFLSNNPQRAVAQVAGHELTHVFEATTLPDGTRLGDVLHDQIRRGLTPEGLDYANKVFGKAEAGAPQRAAFPEGDEGDAAHADAYMRHLITEIGADIGGEAPKFQTFVPKIVNEVQARYGDETAKGIVKKLIAGIRQTVQTLRDIFFKPEELNQYGPADTASQHWVTNLGEIHDTLAKMYAERFGTQAEKTNAALRDMKDKAQRDRLLKAPETTAEGVNRPAGPQGAVEAPEGQPPPGTAPAAPAAPPAAYEVSRQKAATYKRWLGEMQGGNPRDIEKVRKAYQAERQRMADILATMPAEQVGGTGPQKRLGAPALVTPPGTPPRPAATPENVYRPETHGAPAGSEPTAARSGFEHRVQHEIGRIWADKSIMGATHRGIARNEDFARDMARERVMREMAGPELEEHIKRGLPEDAVPTVAKYYRPADGETPAQALDKAVDRWMTQEEAKASQALGTDEETRNYDMLTKEGNSDPVLREMFDRLHEHYQGENKGEIPGDEDIPLGTSEAPPIERTREAPAREEGRGPEGEEAGGKPRGGGEPAPEARREPVAPEGMPEGSRVIGKNQAGQDIWEAPDRRRVVVEADGRRRETMQGGGLVPDHLRTTEEIASGTRPKTQAEAPTAAEKGAPDRLKQRLEEIKAKREEVLPPAPEAKPEPPPVSPHAREAAPEHQLAERIADKLDEGWAKGTKPFTAAELQHWAEGRFGGTLASGAYSRDRLYDALELGVNRFIQRHPERFSADVDAARAREIARDLAALKDALPTQTVRAGEKDAYQQFSTPPDYAYAANWIARVGPGDHVLEPSAGVGGLIVHAMTSGARETTVNELSDKRRGMIAALNPSRITGEDAAQLHNILPADVRPTVVVMNPPFSRAAERMGGKMVADEGAKHIEQALARLEPGGRLVAIVGDGMKPEGTVSPGGQRQGTGRAFRDWWNRIGALYDVRANVGVDREIYTKYGTSFPTRFLVIDKNPPSGRELITGQVKDAAALIEHLKEVRDERSTNEQAAGEPGRAEVAERGEGVARRGGELPRPTGGVGAGEEPGGRAAPDVTEPANAQRRGDDRGLAPELGLEGGGVRNRVVPEQPESLEGRASGEPAAPTEPGAEPDRGFADRGGDGLRPDGSGERDEPGLTPAPEDVLATEAATASPEPSAEGVSDAIYENYKPQRITIAGAKPHPGALVQSAAMASVVPPKTDYKPRLPASLVKGGALSDAQLEAIVYAGHAHSDVMPDGKRRGFFIGDGTGVGKGREIAGILLDNKQQGRTKHVWVSEKQALLADAKRDWNGLGQPATDIIAHGKIKAGDDITAKHGILFTTYETLRAAEQTKVEGEKARGQERVDQIIKWLGKDFDGVIAFDEAHNMGNGVDTNGGRGVKKAAQKALAGMKLQSELPNARVVYVSATGATEVGNLAFADRLGLWGEGTPFPNRNDFVGKVSDGGMAAMELVARDMKALGHYIARSLSYDGVDYDRVEHTLTPDQRAVYDKLAEGWQKVLQNFNAALELTGATADGKTLNSRAKMDAASAFWGGHQRFFNQIITSMQMPSVLKGVEADLKAKRQPVLQLVNTMAAAQDRAIEKARLAGEGDLEDLDMTPRDQLMQLVEKSFPVVQMEEFMDENKNIRSRVAKDSNDQPILNKEAVAMRDRLLDELGSIRVPDGPLEMLLNHFGRDKVAEVTGRTQRVVRDETGKTIIEKRSAQANLADANDFQAGKKPILVFSEAGGTGRSYHAAIGSESEGARRSHYLVQGGWRADKAVQGFGRTHRTSQASAPIFHLVTTDLQGQKRFISSIARRLGQLGALTKGERRTGDQGMFGMRDNLESPEARDGLVQFFRDVDAGKVEGVTMQDLEQGMGLKMHDPKTGALISPLPEMNTFLNRVLSLKIDHQNRVFDAFSERMDNAIDRASSAGTLDTGVETYKADKITKQSEQTVFTDPRSGAETQHVHLIAHSRNHPVDFDATLAGRNKTNGKQPEGFIQNERSGRVFAVTTAGDRTDENGTVTSQVRLTSPVDYQMVDRNKVGENFKKLSPDQARPLWDKQVAETPEFRKSDLHLITGAVLPIWDRLGGSPKIYRLQTDTGERMLGRVIPSSLVDETLKRLGAEGLKVDAKPAEIAKRVLEGETARLANDWTIKRSRVAGEDRLELKGPEFGHDAELERNGIFKERIAYQTRYFIPTEPGAAAKAIEGITKSRPVTRLGEPTAEGAKFSPRQTESPEFKRWFGDSKVVDRDGKPLVVYHGTDARFNAFDRSDDIGFHFGSAETAERRIQQTGEPGHAMPVYLSIHNPLRLPDLHTWDPRRVLSELVDARVITAARADRTDVVDREAVSEMLQAKGYDGIVYRNETEGGGDSYIAMEPGQIKSATGNRGTFDAGNPDIRMSPRITDESRRKDKAYEDARPVYAALGRAPETQTIAQRWEKFKDQLGKRMLIATVDKYLQTKSIDPMAYMAQRNFNSSSGALEVLLTKGTLKLNGSAFDFAQRNGGVETQVIRPLHGEHGDWAWWVAANRAERLSTEDREHLFTPEQIETLKKTNRGQLDFDYELPNGKTTRSREAAFMDTLRKYDEFNKNVMGLGVKAGLFKQETVDKLWANPFYVPFFRVAEKEGAAPFTGGQKTGGFAKQYGFKTLTGGTGKLHNDLWQNVIGNWGHLIDAAGKNIGANQVLDAAERTGVAGKVTQQQYDHQMTKADRDNTTWTMVDGKKQNWHISDPLLFDAVSAIHSANFTDPFSKAANFFSRTLRMGVTSDPGFMLRVTIKDSEQAVATAPMSYNVLGNIVKGYQMTDLPGALRNVVRAAAGMHEEALRESDELVSVMAGGGLMRLGAGHAGGFRKTTAEAMSGEDLTWADGFRYMKRAARQVKEVLAQSEDINRAALYSELIKRGVPHDEATFAARDLEDFTLSGAAPWVRWIAHAVTFLNAGAQGLYKVGRSAADADRNVTAAVGGKLAWAASRRVATVMTATVLATLALDYIYRNNEDYKKRAEYDRNGKWWFHVGKYQFQIPMGFELAGLSRIATNALDMFFDKEMTGRRWANNALSIVGQNMFMNPTPQVIAPLVDVRTNTTGTGQPIEPKGMENLRPEEKFSSQNTLAARGLSTVGNKIARGIGGPTAEFSSPMQLDYLWNGYTGWLGSAILGSADRVARQFTHEPARPAADLWNVATRGVVSQGPTPQSRYIDTMYQQAEAADKAYGTYEDLIKRQQFQKAQDFYKENADLINRRGLVDAVVRSEGSLNQQIRMIQNNPNPQVTGEQKRLMIQQLQAIRNKTAESVFGAH